MAKVKDAVILAGGNGTRMLPASLYIPKETMPLVDTPLINHLIWEAAKAGVSRVHLVLSKRKYEILRDFIDNEEVHSDSIRNDLPRDSLRLGLEKLSIIPHIQSNPGGVGDAISTAIDSLDGPFLVLLGDMLLMDRHVGPLDSGPKHASSASRELVDSFSRNGLPVVGVCPVEMDEVSNYGVVDISDNMVSRIVEKPDVESAPSEYILCGRYIFPNNTKEILEMYPVSEFGEMQSIEILNHLIENLGLRAVKLEHIKMYDSGNPLSWLKSQIDHALQREDLGNSLTRWMEERLRQRII